MASLLKRFFSIFGRNHRALDAIQRKLVLMSQQMDDLQSAVAAESTVIDSAITLLKGLADQIAAGAGDTTAMTRLASEVRAKADALSSAVVANTPAGP